METCPRLQTTNGKLHFNNNQVWSFNQTNKDHSDFETTALHKIWHALSLNHSSDTSAVMYPRLGLRQGKTLQIDDIVRIHYSIIDNNNNIALEKFRNNFATKKDVERKKNISFHKILKISTYAIFYFLIYTNCTLTTYCFPN